MSIESGSQFHPPWAEVRIDTKWHRFSPVEFQNPNDVSNEEWTFMETDVPQRQQDLREIFNGLHWLVRAGALWRLLPHDLPSWEAVYQQATRWLAAGCFEAIAHDLRELRCEAQSWNR
jgi:transposase